MLLLKDLVSGRGRWKENYGLFPKFGHSIYGDCPLREAIKKDYEILDIVKNSETPPPRLVWTKKFRTLRLGLDPEKLFNQQEVSFQTTISL